MIKDTRLEFKVGLFVLTALAAITFFIWSITDPAVFEDGKSLKVIFTFANGLKKTAPVRIAGVDEGIVKDISLFFDQHDNKTKAEVILWIKKNTQIPIDSTITINQLGLLGEKYIEIIPGMDTRNFLQTGQTVIGKNPIPQEMISEKVLTVANKIEESISGINKIINDQANVESVQRMLENLSLATGGFNDLLTDVRSGKGTIGRLFYDDRLYEDLQGMTADLRANPWKLLYRPKERRK
ncbi:MAG: MCE family protein [Candidatus Omnitrophica bacterium]|nr:MCE family protein [Candidatus Omnitrophota bacterium]MCB9747584.1 MCE family protein [Candidatus Omnitrophota bacterium]